MIHQPIAMRTKTKKMLAHLTSLFLILCKNIVFKFYKTITLKKYIILPRSIIIHHFRTLSKCRHCCSHLIISRVLHVVIMNCRKLKEYDFGVFTTGLTHVPTIKNESFSQTHIFLFYFIIKLDIDDYNRYLCSSS